MYTKSIKSTLAGVALAAFLALSAMAPQVYAARGPSAGLASPGASRPSACQSYDYFADYGYIQLGANAVIHVKATWLLNYNCSRSLVSFSEQWIQGGVWSLGPVQLVAAGSGTVYDTSAQSGCTGIAPSPGWTTYTFHGGSVPVGQTAAAAARFSFYAGCSSPFMEHFNG
jgi:hypothetical protein